MTVSDRIWKAWWEERGFPIDYIVTRVRESLNEDPLPFALVAHRDGRFLGTASVIESDLAERPQYSPWVAAVWVEPEHRAARDAFTLGFDRAYLCASSEKRGFYARRGWTQIEEAVGESRLAVLVRSA